MAAKNAEAVALLLAHGADPHQKTSSGMSPLMLARSAGLQDLARTLERALRKAPTP